MGTVVLDIDGMLVDMNYYYAVVWYWVFKQYGFVLLLWCIHCHIGMGGDQLVGAFVGDGFERE